MLEFAHMAKSRVIRENIKRLLGLPVDTVTSQEPLNMEKLNSQINSANRHEETSGDGAMAAKRKAESLLAGEADRKSVAGFGGSPETRRE